MKGTGKANDKLVGNEVNLKEIFTEQEMKNFLAENFASEMVKSKKSSQVLPSNYSLTNGPQSNHNRNSRSPTLSSKKVNSFLFDRTKFILKLLKMCKEKLTIAKEKTLVKGLEWLSIEIDDSMLFKSDDLTIKKLDQLKKENKEMQNIFDWLEECSTIKIKQKEGLPIKKLQNVTNEDVNLIPFAVVKKYLKGQVEQQGENGVMSFNYSTPRNKMEEKFINFSQECISNIEDPTFDIFALENEVGPDNTLSVISCYIFTTMGLYSLIQYDKFELFIQSVAKGYKRENPYHNVTYL